MTHTCPHCKNQFQPKRLDQVYCRHACRQGAYIMRKGFETGKRQNKASANPLQGVDLAALLGNMQPEMFMQVLSGIIQNPSLTDKVTGNVPVTPEKSKEEVKKPSQNFSDGSRENLNKHGKFMEDSWRSLNQNVNSGTSYTRPFDENDIQGWMVEQNLTISIGKNGYVRSLFPHWENKEWYLSLDVNRKLLLIFDRLKKASWKGVISSKMLRGLYNQTREFCEGLYAFLLPEDYPFMNFVRLLTFRLTKLMELVGEKSKIKFRVPDDLHQMMGGLEVQLEQ